MENWRPARPDSISMITREPIGVVGVVVPWNFPLLIASWKLDPALATITFKDDEEAVNIANDTISGLQGSLWTRDITRAPKVYRSRAPARMRKIEEATRRASGPAEPLVSGNAADLTRGAFFGLAAREPDARSCLGALTPVSSDYLISTG
jgi:hypothetical protein